MLQVPTLPNQMTQPIYTQPACPPPNYNAVKIDIHNPSVGVPNQFQPQYAPVTNPMYSYPQAQLYNYPQAVQQPYYVPPMCPPCEPPKTLPAQEPVNVAPVAPSVTPIAPQAVPVAPEPVAPVAPQAVQVAPEPVAPVAQTAPVEPLNSVAAVNEVAPKEAPKVEVAQPADAAPQVDLNNFIARLTNPDYEVQANTMEEIANMVKDEPQKATELLDSKVIDALVNIVNTDSSKLAGPTQEQIAARQKLMSGQQISDEEKALAVTITPMEQAERNKSYAMFTSAILQKLYGDEVAKLTGTTVPLTELPAAMTIVDQLKDNPNPMVRTSAIEALSYIQNPEYKKDLTTLFTIAKNDQDKGVQDAATAALEKLNQI